MKSDRNFVVQLLLYAFLFTVVLAPAVLTAQPTLVQPTGIYTPKSLLIPLHDQKNQLHISVGRGGGYDINLSYAFTDKLAAFHTSTFDYAIRDKVNFKGLGYRDEIRDYVLKGGLGIFTKTSNEFIMEAYAGIGLSKIDHKWYFTGGNYGQGEATRANYWSAFGQYNIGKKRRRSEYAFGLRLAYSNYTDFSYFYYSNYISANESPVTRTRTSQENIFSAEPAISYSYKMKGLKLNAQTGYAITPHWAVLGRLSLQYNLNFSKES